MVFKALDVIKFYALVVECVLAKDMRPDLPQPFQIGCRSSCLVTAQITEELLGYNRSVYAIGRPCFSA